MIGCGQKVVLIEIALLMTHDYIVLKASPTFW